MVVATGPVASTPLIPSKSHSWAVIWDPAEGVLVDRKVTVWPGSGWAGEDVKEAVGWNCWTGNVRDAMLTRPPASCTRMRTVWSPAEV